MEVSSQNRIHGLDVARSAAIFLVVLQHCWSMLSLDEATGSIQHHLYSSVIYGVALFIMISGALNLRNVVPVFQFYRKRYVRVLLPFLVWATVAYVLSSFLGKYDCVQDFRSGIRMYLPFLLTGKINAAFWFVYLISAYYLITPLLQRVLCGHGLVSEAVLIIAILIWFAVETFFPVSGTFGSFVLYFGYYLAGTFLVRHICPLRSRFKIPAAGAGFVLFFLLNAYLRSIGQVSFPVEFGETVSLFILLSGMDIQSRFVEELSRYSYFIYLTHFILIRTLYSVLQGIIPQIWYIPLLTAFLVIAFEYVLCRVLEKISWLPGKVIGI